MRVVHTSKRFKVLKHHKDFIVVKHNNFVYKEHGHFKTLYSAREFINIVEKGELPNSTYYRECALRVLGVDEYSKLKPKKVRIKRKTYEKSKIN